MEQKVKILLTVTGEFADSALPSEDMKRVALDREFYTLDLSIADEVENLFEASLREALANESIEVSYTEIRVPTIVENKFTEAITITLTVTSPTPVDAPLVTQVIQDNINVFSKNLSQGDAYITEAILGTPNIVASIIQEGGKRKTRRRRYQRKSRSRSNRKTKSQKKSKARK